MKEQSSIVGGVGTSAPAAAGPPTGTDTLLVSCRDVSLTFGTGSAAVVAVHGSSCTVRSADQIAIVGPSGSGKSSLLHLIAGLETPTAGSIQWPALRTTPEEDFRSIGVVFQGPSLIPTLTAAENVALPLQLAGVSEPDAGQRVTECLARVGADGLADRLPEELSGGQAQRVAVARVLAQRPMLILADEPTGQLDHPTGQRVVDALLAAARGIGAALVISTHDPVVAGRVPIRWRMQDGRLDTDARPAGGRA